MRSELQEREWQYKAEPRPTQESHSTCAEHGGGIELTAGRPPRIGIGRSFGKRDFWDDFLLFGKCPFRKQSRLDGPLFTPAAILASTKAMFRGSVTRAVYVTPQAGEGTPAALKLALAAPAKASGSSRLAASSVKISDLPAIGASAEPLAIKPTGLLEIKQIDYANGVKVILWPTSDEPGRVTLKVRFGAGWRAFSPQTAPYATLGEMALVDSGVGPLDREAMDRAMTGRKIGFEFDIDDSNFTFKADTRAPTPWITCRWCSRNLTSCTATAISATTGRLSAVSPASMAAR